MLSECPDPKEVSDFHFLQLRTLRLVKPNEIPTKYVNLLTCASKYDLLFVGVERGFKVLELEEILALDEDKENRSILEKYGFSFVSCDTPALLAVNATQTVLAVCTKNVSGTVLFFYSLSNFPGFDRPWQPFCSKILSPPGFEIKDFAWNPALEGLYSYCLMDGSLHIHEISGTTIKSNASLPNANALSVCWSPKGKQLVVGKSGGSFSQYKPTLDPVNTVMPPALEEGPVSVTSICWISTTVFAVVYVSNDMPNLFIVSTPKAAPVTYVNFNDVCLGNNSIPDQKYLMHLEPSWGLLICASVDSIEIAALGDMPNWVQWDLKEDGKALLPGKDGALNAVGMTVMYSAQKQIIISDSVSYPPMPVMFLLTNNGLLVSFHMINEKPNTPSLVSSPVPIELKICSGNEYSLAKSGFGTSEMTEKKSFMFPTASLTPSTSVIGRSVTGSQTSASVNLSQNVSLGMEAKSAFTPSTGLESTHNLHPGSQTFIANKSEVVHASSAPESEKNNFLQKSPGYFGGKENDVQLNTGNSYMAAIIAEIESFEKELQDLNQLQKSLPAISVEDDMASLKAFALNLENFKNDITETMQSLSSDIYTLKNVLLESFVLYEEASSRERRRNDHSYITMLKERALDPITARRMQKMNQLFQYLSTQLQEVNNKLDQDWILRMANKKKMLRNNFCISSTEAIYKTIVNNQKIIHNFRKNVDVLLKKAEEKKLRNITNSGTWIRHHKRLPQEDLSKLADEFLQVKINHQEEREPTQTRKLSLESQNVLKDFLKKSSVVTVRPTAVYSPSQSRLLSNAVAFDDSSGSDQAQDISPKIISAPPDKEMNKKSLSVREDLNVTTTFKQSRESTPVKPYFPVCEPVTPPDVPTIAPEPVNKTATIVSQETNPEAPSHASSISATVNLNQGSYSSLLSDVKSNKEPPKFSFASEIKSPFFNQAASEAFSSASTVFSKPFSFTTSIQKDSDSTVSKPLIISSSSSLPATNFSFGQKRDFLSSTASSVAPSAVTSILKPDFSNSITPENSKLIQQDKPVDNSNTVFYVSTSNNNVSPIVSVAKTSVSTPLLMTTETKLSSSTQDNENLSVTLPLKTSTGFLFGSSKTEQQTKKDDNTTKSSFFAGETLNLTVGLVNKTVSVVTQSPSSQEQSIHVDSLKSTNKSNNSNVSLSQVGMNLCLRNDNLLDTSKETKVSGSDLSELKQPISLSVAPSEPIKSSSLPSEVDSVVSTIPSTTSSEVLSAASTETTSSLSNLLTSKPPPPPPLTALPLQTSPSSPADLFGQTVSTTTSETSKTCQSDVSTTSSTLITGQAQSETPSFFTNPKTDVSTSSETSTTQTPFGQQPASTTVPQVTTFVLAPVTTVSQTTLFGQPPSTTAAQTNLFAQPSTTLAQSAPFGQPASVSVTQSSFFGQPTSAPSFPTSGGFFSQTSTFGASDASSAVTSASSDFSNQSSTFSFGKPAFGQTTTGSFGLAKSFFGQNTPSFTQSTTPSSFSFSQNSNSAFGQGSFFSGLGGKPSEENASKNVFGIGSNLKSSDTNSLFKNSSIKSFGTVNGNSFSAAGSFSSGGGSVAQSGFGSFQQTPTQQSGGFGAAPTFGGSPAFGSPPAFGSSPAFGSGNTLSPGFGQQQVSSNFSNFANASSPTFGSLASQTPPAFGTSPGFGSPSFGSAPAFGSSSFGGQSPGFGSPGSPAGSSSAFTQWRN